MAILYALPKPRLRYKHLPCSYWLIALLSCLDIALEKVIIRKLSEIAIRTRLSSPIHYGTVARLLAVDAATRLIYDVKKAWQDGEVFTALASDIKGVFDTVMEKKLSVCLWKQNISLSIIRWIAAYFTEKKAAIQLDDHIRS